MSSTALTPFTQAFIKYVEEYQRIVARESVDIKNRQFGCSDPILAGMGTEKKIVLNGFGKKLVKAATEEKNYCGLKEAVEILVSTINSRDHLIQKFGSRQLYNLDQILSKTEYQLVNYFKDKQLNLALGLDSTDGENFFIDFCLGKASVLKLGTSQAIIFEEKLITKTVENIPGEHQVYAWTDGMNRYYDLGLYVKDGQVLFNSLKNSQLRYVHKSDQCGSEETPLNQIMYKLLELAMKPLYKRFKDKETFVKAYGAYSLASDHMHEVYHDHFSSEIPYENQDLKEATAELYRLSRSLNPFQDLRSLYNWENYPQQTLQMLANELCFDYLNRVGYTEEAFMNLKPLDENARKKVVRQLQTWADQALILIEKDYNLPSHVEIEEKLGIDWAQYRQEVETKLINS